MKKLLTTIAMILFMYIIPLLGNIGLLLNLKMILLMIGCTILLFSQPAMSVKEANTKKDTDRFSMYGILFAAALSQIVSVSDWRYFHYNTESVSGIVLIGVTMFTSGIIFRVWAIRILGKFFTATVQVQSGQKVIKSGPYKFIRHPSYLGFYISLIGSAFMLESIAGTTVAVIAMGYAYYIRISAEEKVMLREFGDEYSNYQKQTYRIIPCVW